jgi:membrane-associated phospholipid phosphatase
LIALVVLAYFFGDRQLAGALRPYTNGVPFFIWLTYVVKPLTVAACLTVAIVAIIAIRKPELSPLCSGLLRIACAILVAGVLTFELKEAFGRTWPETWINNNPSYFGNGTYGFFPFHGGQGWASFPSGHTTAVSALAGALWFLWPELRWLGVALVLAVAVGLLGADYHWLSDILAGGIVGGTTGAAAARIGRHTGV